MSDSAVLLQHGINVKSLFGMRQPCQNATCLSHFYFYAYLIYCFASGYGLRQGGFFRIKTLTKRVVMPNMKTRAEKDLQNVPIGRVIAIFSCVAKTNFYS